MRQASDGQKRLLAGTAIFACGILLITKFDHMVNSTLYGNGTKLTIGWYWPYSAVYFLLLQGFAVVLYLYVRKMEALLVAESFVLSGSADIVYFGAWNGGVFPPGQWSWTLFYQAFGRWTTADQLALSASSMALAGAVVLLLRRKRMRRPKKRR